MKWVRRALGNVRRAVAPGPDIAAYRALVRHAQRAERRTPGTVRVGSLTLAYTDALTLCPQWNDIFLRKTMAFVTSNDSPRILDCGANVGLATLWFKRHWPRARITAFEADPNIAACLRDNLRANGAGDVEVVEAAVWSHADTVQFHREGADSGAVRDASESTVEIVETPAVRLKDYLNEPVDFLKLDVEGAEYTLLDDCADALHSVRAMYAELHEFDPSSRQVSHALQVLRAQGFDYALDELVPMPWRATAGSETPFPNAATHWALVARAWRQASA